MAKYVVELPERFLLADNEEDLKDILTFFNFQKFLHYTWGDKSYALNDEQFVRIQTVGPEQLILLTPEQEEVCEEKEG